MNPISIFIVEDELLISASLASQLQSFGYQILGSSTRGEQCVQEIEKLTQQGREPQIVLMDIHLRGDIDGIETARRLVEKTNCAIIFLTGQSSKEIYERSFKIKPFGYLLKPIDMEQTKMTIEIAAYQRDLEVSNKLYQQQLEGLLAEKARETDEITILFQNVANNSIVGMAIIQDGKIVYANRHTADLWGLTLDELIGMDITPLNMMVHPEEREILMSNLMRRLKGENISTTGNFRFVRNDGKIRHLEYSSLLTTYHGRPAIHQIYYDITKYTQSPENL